MPLTQPSSTQPASAQALAAQLSAAAHAGKTVEVAGGGSKVLAGGPICSCDVQISTLGLNRILHYERNDLTISVEAGLRWSDLQDHLAQHGQMIALDSQFSAHSTVGGVLATDLSGPLRKRFGTARDQVIGMSFALVDGRMVRAGGMVVKNVAGLDLAKLLIGSYGTLAVMTSVNFRVHPKPQGTRTFLFSCRSVEDALNRRDHILNSPLHPWAVELLSPTVSARLGRRGILLAVRAAGSSSVLARYERELAADEQLAGSDDAEFWTLLSNFTSDFLCRNPSAVVIRLTTPPSKLGGLLRHGSLSYLSQAGSGITDAYFDAWPVAAPFWALAQQEKWRAVIAFAPNSIRSSQNPLWLRSGSPAFDHGFAMMEKVKLMFDPGKLLNPKRLYGCF